MTIATASQWSLLGGYIACAAGVGVRSRPRFPRLRPVAGGRGDRTVARRLLCAIPDLAGCAGRRGDDELSIAIRYQVLFTAALLLALAVKRRTLR
jgi:hypothetical protein